MLIKWWLAAWLLALTLVIVVVWGRSLWPRRVSADCLFNSKQGKFLGSPAHFHVTPLSFSLN